MKERVQQLMGELVNEITKASSEGAPPTGITRQNLNQMRIGLAAVVATATCEQEFTTPDVRGVGDTFYKELQDAEVKQYQEKGQGPNEPMNWQDVRDLYALWLTMAIAAITPEGIAKRKAALKAADEAAAAVPSLNEMKTGVPDTIIKTPTDAQLVS